MSTPLPPKQPAPNPPVATLPKCSVCGNAFPTQHPHPAISFNAGAKARSAKVKAAVATQVAPYDVNKTYTVCVPCYLKALGVKP